MKSLVLAEKPSVARDIARVLKCHKNLPGAIEGNSYVGTWSHWLIRKATIKNSKNGICLSCL